MTARRRVLLIGPGRLGCSLGYALARLDGVALVGVGYHSPEGLQRSRRWLPDTPAMALQQIDTPIEADVVVLTVRDDVIARTAATLTDRLDSGQVLLHTSGLLSAEVMRVEGLRAALGSFHPLQTFTTPSDAPERFGDCFVACEGDVEAVEAGLDLGRQLGAETLVLPSEAKIAYHAAAVVASNYLVVITEMATILAAEAGIDGERAIRMLAPLQRGSLANLSRASLPAALTGPIARGDVATVAAHVDLIERTRPSLRPAYAELGRLAVGMAERLGQDPRRLAEILALLKS